MSRVNLKEESYKFYIIVASILSLSIIIFTTYFAKFGFDITDEGFYFNNIINPWEYGIGITLFGYIYHYFYIVLFKNFFYLRIFNLYLILLLSWATVICLFKYKLHFPVDKTKKIWQRLLFFNFGTIGLLFIYFPFSWLITPNYNLLNYQGMLLSAIGVLLITEEQDKKTLLGYILLSVGGTIVFFAKPSSSSMLAVVTLSYLYFMRYINFTYLFLVCVIFLVISVLLIKLISLSLHDFYSGLKISFENYQMIVSDQTIFRLDLYIPQYQDKIFLLFSILIVSYVSSFYLDLLPPILTRRIKFSLLGIACFVTIVLILKNRFIFSINQMDYLVFPFIALLVFFMHIFYTKKFNNESKNILVLGLFFLSLPYIFSFGTTNPYWMQSQFVAFFWVVSSICFLSQIINYKYGIHLISFFLMSMLLIMAYLMNCSLDSPYRQNSFKNLGQYTKCTISENTSLMLNKEFINCFESMKKKIYQSGFHPQTEVIDFTGVSPGLIPALNGKAVGAAWIFRLEQNYVPYAVKNLQKVLTNSNRAWLFIDDNNDTDILNILRYFHLSLEKDYELVYKTRCRFHNNSQNTQTIMVYKPKD